MEALAPNDLVLGIFVIGGLAATTLAIVRDTRRRVLVPVVSASGENAPRSPERRRAA